jgi:hypothetical protein
MEEAEYPYTSGTSSATEECVHDPAKSVVTISGYDTLPANNHDAVMTHIAEVTACTVHCFDLFCIKDKDKL